MERIISRARRLSPLHSVSDVLWISLLSKSDSQPDSIQQGVVLFEKGEPTSYWYLLLCGEIQLFDKDQMNRFRHLTILKAGSLFGDLSTHNHSCSCIVSKQAQLIRISQQHFLSVYNKHGDYIQPFIVIMHDLFDFPDEGAVELNVPQMDVLQKEGELYPLVKRKLPTILNGTTTTSIQDIKKFSLKSEDEKFTPEEKRFIEFRSSNRVTEQIETSGEHLQRRMLIDGHGIIRDVFGQNNNFRNCMIGSDMVDWLLTLFVSTSASSTCLSRLQMCAIWQVLLNNSVIVHVDGEQMFSDKSHAAYRWSKSGDTNLECDKEEDIMKSITFLASIAPETLFLMILSKPKSERSPEELDIVYEELVHIKSLSHLSTMVKRQLANIVEIEKFSYSGSLVFRQGEVGTHWYIILKGAVDVDVYGKGVVCSLREGDDFGKLALINDSPRAATIITKEEDSIFLIVDKHSFNQVLHEVEANTVRLREFGEDVLVLEKIEIPRGAAVESTNYSSNTNCGYSVMAGKAGKILEYLLETRIDALSDDVNEIDTFVEDFILTQEAFMPANAICNFLKAYYFRSSCKTPTELKTSYQIASKRRVVKFVQIWCSLLGVHFFLNPVAKSFVEELFCYVIDDQKAISGMEEVVARIASIRSTRETMQLTLARHPSTVIDCGVLSAHTPMPILPSDICNQIINLEDTTFFVLPIRVDKSADEICELSRRRMRYNNTEQLSLVEVKSNGEKLIFSPGDRAIPTVLNLNSKLYVVSSESVTRLTAMDEHSSFNISSHPSVLQLIDAQELAHQLLLFHSKLVGATDTSELLYQVIGRESFPLSMPYNLDLLVRRFNEVQHWATTEVLLAPESARMDTLRKFIKIAVHSRENQDLLTVFAITLGLSHISISRLTTVWSKLQPKFKKQFLEFENLLDPTRNHRVYRVLVSKMVSPFIPFVPLILKDLMFVHQGNKSFYNGLVNFEKMHMFANVLRSFRSCKILNVGNHEKDMIESQSLIRNLRIIENQRILMQLSYKIEQKSKREFCGAP